MPLSRPRPSAPTSPPQSAKRPTILLTGGAGVLGRALIEELSPDFRIICLRHRTPVNDHRVREVRADLLEPGLGLTRADLAQLTADVDLVVHSAAATNWKAEPDQIRRANLDGTIAMLDLAVRAGARFFHMSTAFVANPLAPEEQERFPAPPRISPRRRRPSRWCARPPCRV